MNKTYSTFMVFLDVYTDPAVSLNEEMLSEMLGLRNNVTESRLTRDGKRLLWRYESLLNEKEPLELHLKAILALIEDDKPVRTSEPIKNIYLNVAFFCAHFFSCTEWWPGKLIASLVSKFPDIDLEFSFYPEMDEEE